MKDPKYHIGDEVMVSTISIDYGNTTVVRIEKIDYVNNKWYYNNGTGGFWELDVIKKL